MTKNITAEPFSGDGEYLDAEIRHFLPLRLARIQAQRDLAQAERAAQQGDGTHSRHRGSVRELRGLVPELVSQEDVTRAEIDRRLQVHRGNPDNEPMGLDKLCEDCDRDENERLLLLAICVPSISPELVTDLLDHQWCNRLQVSELCMILDPRTVQDWLRVRSYFHSTSRLLKHNLVALEPMRPTTAQSLMLADIGLSSRAMAIITSSPELEREVASSDGDAL